MSLGERAARQESSSLNLRLSKAREAKAQRKCQLKKEAANRLTGVDTEPQRQATTKAALLPVADSGFDMFNVWQSGYRIKRSFSGLQD